MFHRHFLAISLLILSFASFAHPNALSREVCTHALFGERIPERPLPTLALEMIDRHAGLQAVANRVRADKSLYFSLSHLQNDESRVPENNKTGEFIQALFVRAVLERAFPGVTFDGGDRKSVPIRRPILLTILDSAEGRINSPGKTPPSDGTGEFLEMSLLKAVNPTGSVASRNSIRQVLRIPQTYRVIHLYVRKESAFYAGKLSEPGINFSKILKVLNQSKQKTVLILSGLYQASPDNPQYLYTIDHVAQSRGYAQATSLSALRDGLAPPVRKNSILINDTRGWMHEIHAAADFALVMGAINFFEPLNSGTPTVWFQVPDLYDAPTLTGLEQIARKTGRFVSCRYCSQLKDRLKEADGGSPLKRLPPYLTTLDDGSGKTQFELFLDQLTQIIERQINH